MPSVFMPYVSGSWVRNIVGEGDGKVLLFTRKLFNFCECTTKKGNLMHVF